LPLLAAVAGTFVLLALQALRWWWVVRPVLPLGYREAFSAMLVGSAFNVLIPARGGDLIRVQYLGKRTGTSRVTLLGTELLDYWSDKAGWLLAFVLTCVVSAVGWKEGPPIWLVRASESWPCWSLARERWRSSPSSRCSGGSPRGWTRGRGGSRSCAPGSRRTTGGASWWWSSCSRHSPGSGRCRW
jgi:hypothetical protein